MTYTDKASYDSTPPCKTRSRDKEFDSSLYDSFLRNCDSFEIHQIEKTQIFRYLAVHAQKEIKAGRAAAEGPLIQPDSIGTVSQ